ncbi:MAG: DEAD/DEAH box helicase family protein, partial [Terriglobales bacterium]
MSARAFPPKSWTCAACVRSIWPRRWPRCTRPTAPWWPTTPGTGKTVIACALAAKRKVSTLVLVHRAPLMEQWKAWLKEFLGLKDSEIGTLGGQRKKLTGKLD